MRKYNLKTGVLVYGGKRLNSCLFSDLLFDFKLWRETQSSHHLLTHIFTWETPKYRWE
jgi:hypothetical protein